MAKDIELKDVIKFKNGNYVIAADSGFSVQDVNDLLAQTAARSGKGAEAQMLALAQTIVEPIDQALPYILTYTGFFTEVPISDLQDPSIPREQDIIGLCFEVHPESEVFFVRPSFRWYRPELKEFSAGVEMPWKLMQRAGWNVMQRMMLRATDCIARQIDAMARAALDGTILATAGMASQQAGTTLTKAAMDALIKAAHTLGFPMVRAAINSGTVTDIAGWTAGATLSTISPPEREARELLQRLYLGNYGGVEFHSNPFVPTRFLYFSGQSNMTGFHIVRGRTRADSDVDIRKGIDLHAIRTAEHAFTVENANNIRRLEITGLI